MKLKVLLLGITILNGVPGVAAIHYVNIDLTTGANNGITWANAYHGADCLQTAIDDASDDVGGGQVWVRASSTPYSPITLANNVKVYGGFYGNETYASASNPWTYVTTINADGAEHAVTSFGNDSTAVLRGFAITGGNAPNGDFPYHFREEGGGGIYLDNSNAVIVNCDIHHNVATWTGGGIATYGGNPTFINCKFHHNGEILCGDPPSPCEWTGGGGGVYIFAGNPEFHNCLFFSTKAYSGGAVFVDDDYTGVPSTPKLYDCTFTKNTAVRGQGGAVYQEGSDVTLRNCILWGDTASYGPTYAELSSFGIHIALVNNSDIQGGWTRSGTGNINLDPLFSNPSGDVYALQSTSPCKNAGVNTLPKDVGDLDWDGVTVDPNGEDIPKDLAVIQRRVGLYVDMGAYEYQDLFSSCNADSDCMTWRHCCNNVCQACCIDAHCARQGRHCKIGATNACVWCLNDSECGEGCCIDGWCEMEDCPWE